MATMARDRKRLIDPWTMVMILTLIILDVIFWSRIFARWSTTTASARIYFMSTPQADAAFVILPSGITMLIDAGSDDSALLDLPHILPYGDNSIDVAIILSPQAKYFGGYNHILDHYRIGAFLYDGRDAYYPDSRAWTALTAKIKAKKIPLIPVGKGDSIRFSGGAHDTQSVAVDIIFPDKDFGASAALDDAALAVRLKTATFAALFADAMSLASAHLVFQTKNNAQADAVSLTDNLTANFIDGLSSTTRPIIINSTGKARASSSTSSGSLDNSSIPGMIRLNKGDIVEVSTILGKLRAFLLYN